MTTTIEDLKGGMSSCCFAPMYFDQGICSDCKEYCDNVEDDTLPTPKQREFSAKQKEIIENLKTEEDLDIGYYYISYRVAETNGMVGLPFGAYYSEAKKKALFEDPQIIIESFSGDFDREYVESQSKKNGTKIID